MSEIAQVVALQKQLDKIMEIAGEELAAEVHFWWMKIDEEHGGTALGGWPYDNLPASEKIYFQATARRWLCRLLAELQDKGYEW